MIKIANNLANLVIKQAAKRVGSGLKQKALDALIKHGPNSKEYHGLIMKLTNEQLLQDATDDDGVVDWATYYGGPNGEAYTKAKKYADERHYR